MQITSCLKLPLVTAIAIASCSSDPIQDNARAAALAGGQSGGTVPAATPATGLPPVGPNTPSDPLGAICGMSDVQVSRTVPHVMLLVDGSSSMRTMYGIGTSAAAGAGGAAAPRAGSGGAAAMPPAVPVAGRGGAGGAGGAPAEAQSFTRWRAIRQALVDPVNGVVARLDGMIKFGLAVYGTEPMCPLPGGITDPAIDNFEQVQAAFPLDPPGTRTPTGPALDAIVDRLADPARNVDPEDASSPRIIVLATDGDPNSCDMAGNMPNYEPSIMAALKAQSKSQRLYVISVGLDAARDHLQKLANIGAGMPADAVPGAQVFYPNDPVSLSNTLTTLIGTAALCEVKLEGAGVKAGMECGGVVMLNGQALGCNDPNGWKLSDATHIQLQGTACDLFRAGNNAMVRARFPCELLVPQ